MTKHEREALIEMYAAGADEVEDALKGFPTAKLTAHPLPGKWSAREIVHHLGDSESTSALRLRRLVAEDKPVIVGYDQDTYAVLLRYNLRDHAPALAAFRAARETTAQILREMSDEDWKREGWHTEMGRYSAETWLSVYAVHAHNHAAQIRRLRETVTHKD